MMSDQVSDWGSIEGSSFQQQWSSPYHGEVTVLHDFSGSLHDQPQPQPQHQHQPQPITTWPQTPCSSMTEEDITYSDIFKVLSNIVQLQPSPSTLQASTTTRTVSLPILDKGKGESSVAKMKDGDELEHPWTQSKGTARAAESKKNQDDKRPKRTRSAETHNMSERMRRDRIRGKIRELQELIPNCYKTNRVSVLDEAIGYLKALKHQVEVMSMGGGIMCQAPYTSPTQYQGIEMPHYYPSIAIWPRMGFGMGMGSMSSSSSTGVVMIPIPSPSLHSPQSAATGVVPVPHVQLPFNPSQPWPAAPYVSVVQPTFHSRSQQDVPTICTDFQQQNMPMTSQLAGGSLLSSMDVGIFQNSIPCSSSRTVLASQIIRPSSLSGSAVAEAPQFHKAAVPIQDNMGAYSKACR